MMRDLSEKIPPRARCVVELGCGSGETGEAFLRLQPEADYWGFETEAESVREAAGRLPHALQAEPETLSFEACGLYRADVLLIRGSYLRALSTTRLKAWAGLLPEDGQLLVELPNPGYFRRLLASAAGRPDGMQVAVCTLPELQSWLQQAGLHMAGGLALRNNADDADLKGQEQVQVFLRAMASVMSGSLGWRNVHADIWAEGWLVRAVRREVQAGERMMVHTVLGETVVTPRVRVLEPNGFMATEPYVATAVEAKAYDIRRDRGFDRKVFIRQRLIYTDVEQGLSTIQGLRSQGYVILTEMDDNPILWLNEDAETKVLSYMGAHALQVSTEPLAEVVRQYNPHVKVLRNELRELPEQRDYERERLERMAKNGGKPYVTVFFGALNRTKEWQDIMPALNEAAARYGEGLRFKVLSDRGFYEALQTEYKEFIGTEQDYGGQFVPYEEYQRVLHSADISLLPLHDTDFNRTKSDLKFIESAGHGAVALASPVVYASTLRDGRTGFLYRDAREFAERLRLLVEDRSRRLETAEAAYCYVRRERLLSQHYMERLAWYNELFKRRTELDKELEERLGKWQAARGKQA